MPPEEVKEPEETAQSPSPAETKAVPASTAVPGHDATKTAAAQGSPMDNEDDNGECNLLGNFALLVQGALGLLAVSSLAVKRWREEPRRPLKIWFFDVSKQVFGSVLLHLANILMSMLSSGKFDVAASTSTVQGVKGEEPNPCSFYLLNLAIDVSPPEPSPPPLPTNIPRPPSASPSSSSCSKSSTQAQCTLRSPTRPNPSAQATTGTRRAQPGGSSNPCSTS